MSTAPLELPRLVHKGSERKTVNDQAELDAALADGFTLHHGEEAKKKEVAAAAKAEEDKVTKKVVK